MLRQAILLSLLAATAAVSQAQTGFTTKTYPAMGVGSGGEALRVADFNQDGRPDLLSYSPGSDSGYVYMNDGSGGFKAPVALPTPDGDVLQARVADMNGDGYPDIVECTYQAGKTSSQSYLVILLNDKTGNFSVSDVVTIPGSCSGGMRVGDVNMDGRQDVIIAEGIPPATTSTYYNNVISTYFGDGAGKVGTPVTQSGIDLDDPNSTISNSFTNCGLVDITGGNFYLDGKFSLIVNSQCHPYGQNNPGNLGTTFLGHGNNAGNYTFTQSHTAFAYLTDGQTVDVNLDGKPDATFYSVTGLQYSDLYYAQNNGGGSFTYNILTSDLGTTSGYNMTQITGDAVADLTGDGLNDIAAIFNTQPSGNPYQNGPANISIIAGQQNGTFTTSQTFALGSTQTFAGDIVAADFNGDGKIDLAAIASNETTQVTTLYVYTNTLGSAAACSAPTTTNTNIICAPARGSTVTSPFTVTAASNVTGFTANRLYLDNVAVYTNYSQTISTPLTASPGSHNLVLVSYDNSGKAFSYSSTFTVGAGSGCVPSAPGVSICAPAPGATAASPVTITAGALAQSGNLTAIRAYIDNSPVLTVNNPSTTKSFQINQAVTIAPGSHHLVVVGYQSTGGSVSNGEDFTVSGTAACYPSSAGAMICSPGPNATVSSPVSIVGGATTGSGYMAAVRIYVDNVAKDTVTNPQQSKSQSVSTSVSLAAGSHDIVVVGYPSTGGSFSAADTITVP